MRGLILTAGLLFGLYAFAQERGAIRANSSTDLPAFNNVHGLIVGVSAYEEVTPLSWAHNDALLIEKVLQESFADNLGKIYTHTDSEATDFSIISSIIKLIKAAKEGDLVVVYLAGHGDVDTGLSGDDEGYFLAHNASKSREYEMGGTVSFERINKFVGGLTNRGVHVWLITDACRSGKIINAQGAAATLAALEKGYMNTTKFISCRSKELSYEYDSLQHGAFTYFLVRGLAGEADNIDVDGQISPKEIGDYMQMNVRKITNKRQTPTIHAEDPFADLIPVNETFLAYFKHATDELMDVLASGDLASRTGGDDMPQKTPQLIAFEDAVLNGNLYGSQSSALGILEAYKKENQDGEITDDMEEMLVNKILIRVQEQVNIFLSDRPTLGGRQDFPQAKKDLEVVLSLLDKEHPYFPKLERRRIFFEAMQVVATQDFKNYTTVEKNLLDIEKQEKNAAYIHQGLAMLYMAMNDKKKAEEQLAKAKEKIHTWDKPKNTTAHLKIVTGELDQAIEIIEHSSNLDLKGEEIIFLKTELYTASNQLQKAEEELKKLHTNKEYSKSEFYQLEAKLNELRGRIKVAEEFYLKAIEEDKNNASLLAELGDIYRKDGDTTLAVKYFKKALKINEYNQIARNGLAMLKQNEVEKIEDKINYYSVDEVRSVIDFLLSRNETERALKVVEKALNYGKWNAELHYLKGNIYYRLEDKKAAEKSWETALKLNKYQLHAARNLIMLNIENGDKKQAESLIVATNLNFKNSAEWKTIKYNAYRLMHPNDRRVDLLEEALKIDSTNIEIYEWLYELDLKSSNFSSAFNHYKEITRLGGGKVDSIQFLSAVKIQFEREVNMRNKNTAIQGLNLIERFDRNYLFEPLIQAARLYYQGDYKASMSRLNKFERYYFILMDRDKVEHKRLKGYVLLELGFLKEAIEHFKFVNSNSRNTEYMGISMAYYMLGESEGLWLQYFKKDPKLFKFNQTANERFKRMDMNRGYRR
jgi:Flp pilus assembly protein TadD